MLGWFRASTDVKERNEESMVASRLCALHWVIVLYESVVPDELKAEVRLLGLLLSSRKMNYEPHLSVRLSLS